MRDNYMAQEFIMDMSTGMYCPDEQFINSMPLPNEVYYEENEQRVSTAEGIERFRDCLNDWVEFGKTLNRFSKEYIKVSRLLRNAVTVLGRGLMTLRAEGIDPDQFPVKIDDLLDIASFHFNKCDKGTRTAAMTNYAVSFQLLENQLGWLNIIQRLERTELKLHEPIADHHTAEKIQRQEEARPSHKWESQEAFRPAQAFRPNPEPIANNSADLTEEISAADGVSSIEEPNEIMNSLKKSTTSSEQDEDFDIFDEDVDEDVDDEEILDDWDTEDYFEEISENLIFPWVIDTS